MEDDIDINICPECGAELTNDRSCQDYFDTLLAKEFSNSEYGAVHHLSVPAYLLQHPGLLSIRGWLEMRDLLFSFIRQSKPPHEARKSIQKSAQKNQRGFSFTKGESINIENIIWTKTISGIRMEDASAYCQDVQEWASQTLKDSEEFEIVKTR